MAAGIVSNKAVIPSLDGLRALAVLAVIVAHVDEWLLGGTLNTALGAITGAGWIGVDLFFVLSGFLITGILFDDKGTTGYFRNFYVRRSLRIFPLSFA